VAKWIQDNYNGLTVYGDTDSVFVDLGIEDSSQCKDIGTKLAKEISEEFKPLVIKFEHAVDILCLKKKSYIAAILDDDGGRDYSSQDKFMWKGCLAARKDNCIFQTNTYQKLVMSIFENRNIAKAFEIIAYSMLDLLDGKFPIDPDLVISQNLGQNYASDSHHLNVFSRALNMRGKIVNPGDRLEYLIIKPKKETKLLGEKLILVEEYAESEYEIDYLAYITRSANSLEQVMQIVFKEELEYLSGIGLQEVYRGRTTSTGLDKCVRLIIKILQCSELGGRNDIHELVEAVRIQSKDFYGNSD
jgi:DNA polymerase elongation subunit (family B)